MAPPDNIFSFDAVYLNCGSAPGQLRVAPSGIAFRLSATKETTAVPASDIRNATWSRALRYYELKITTKDDVVLRFDGLRQTELEHVRDAVKQLNHVLDVHEYSVKGWNWGRVDVGASELAFSVQAKPAFEIPLRAISNTNLANKMELALEFGLEQNKPAKSDIDELVELRLFVPGSASKDEYENGVGDDALMAANLLYNSIKERINPPDSFGDSIVTFVEILFATPRGRYDIEMSSDFLRLRGKTYDYKVPYTAVVRLYLLPRTDELHMYFIVGLDPPMRQGQTRYPFLIMQFSKEEDMEVELNIDDDLYDREYKDRLQKKYDQAAFQVVSSVFRGLTKRKITVPANFVSVSGQPCIKCSLKAAEGHLYFMDKSFLFVPKPTVLIPNSDIAHATLSRLGGNISASRTFDVSFTLHNGTEYQFLNVAKEEQKGFEAWLDSQKIKVHNDMTEDPQSMLAAALKEEISDDEDSEDGPDRGSADEDSESVDEDFEAESESEVAEEFDENFNGSDAEEKGAGNEDDVEDDDADEDIEDGRPAKKSKSVV